MSKNNLKIATILTLILMLNLIVVLTPAVAGAGLLQPEDCDERYQRCDEVSPQRLLRTAINILLGIAGLVAVLFVIWGGFQYITSGVNEELAEQGKKTLRNAIIGVVIIVLSFVIVNVISNALIYEGWGF